MQGKSLNTILLAIIAVLTLALAVTSIFLFTTLNNKKAGANQEQVKTTAGVRVAPIGEQHELNLYAVGTKDTSGKSKDAVFTLKSTEQNPNSYLMASISIVYDGGDKNGLSEERKKLLEETYLSALKQATIEYFMGKSLEDVNVLNAMQNAREDLKTIYNKIVSEDPEQQIIIKVIFDKWIPQ